MKIELIKSIRNLKEEHGEPTIVHSWGRNSPNKEDYESKSTVTQLS